MSPIATDNQTINQATPASKAELVQLNQEGAVSTSALVSSSTSLTKGDYSKFLSEESAARNPSPLKHLAVKYLSIPDIISFGGGMPHPSTFFANSIAFSFPFLEKTVTVDGFVAPGAKQPSEYASQKASLNADTNINLSAALQYGGSSGAPQLVNFMKEHVRRQFNIPYNDWSVVMTNGNTDGMDNILRMLTNRGDNVLVENFAYPGTLAALFPIGIKPIAVAIDAEGMVPSAMDEILSSWDTSKQGKKPTVVIVVPTGQNPTGTTMGEQRKRDFYAIAQKHDILILSDDPYRALLLHYPEIQGPTPPKASPGFLALDVDGRVLDLSSFSKTIAPGSRCGWLTGPTPLIERLTLRNEVTMQAVSGFSVAAITSFLGGLGSQEAFEAYLEHVAKQYSIRANIMNDAFKKHLPLDLAEWVLPAAGMFIYVRIKAEKHPQISKLSAEGVLDNVFEAIIKEGCITVPSTLFKADKDLPSAPEDVYLRCSFSYNDHAEFEEGAKRFGAGIRKSFGV